MSVRSHATAPARAHAAPRARASITPVAAVALALGACMHHVQLAPPPVAAPISERLAAYEQLSPRGFGSYQNGRATDQGFLVLGDGTRVYYPEDLAPVVPADSPTARAAARHQDAWDRSMHWLKVSGVGFGLAIAVPLLAYAAMPDTDTRTGVMIGGAIGGYALGVGGLVAGLVDAVDANGERASAFLTYDDALRGELRLCVAGLEVYDCAAARAAAPPPSAPVPGVPDEVRAADAPPPPP